MMNPEFIYLVVYKRRWNRALGLEYVELERRER